MKLMTTMFAAIAKDPKLTTAEALRQAMLATMDDRTIPSGLILRPGHPSSWSEKVALWLDEWSRHREVDKSP